MLTTDEQVAILMSGAEYGDPQTKETMTRELRERLIEAEKAGRPLRVYAGFDPRTADIHLGHTIPMRKLRQFQELGHDVTFLVGTFTSLIGDPSDKDKEREQLTREQVEENARTYAQQAFKILDEKLTRVRQNDEWLSTLDFADIIRLASNFTVQQFLVRENFAKRIDAGVPIYLHEFFYALMQAYDAVAQEADVQVGGQDQRAQDLAVADHLLRFVARVHVHALDPLAQLSPRLLGAELTLVAAQVEPVVLLDLVQEGHLGLAVVARESEADQHPDRDRVGHQQRHHQRRAPQDLQVLQEQPAHQAAT